MTDENCLGRQLNAQHHYLCAEHFCFYMQLRSYLKNAQSIPQPLCDFSVAQVDMLDTDVLAHGETN